MHVRFPRATGPLFAAFVLALVACTQSAPASDPSSTPIAFATVSADRLIADSQVLDRWIDSTASKPQYCVRVEFPAGTRRDHCGDSEHFQLCFEAAIIGKEAPMGCVI